MKAIFILSYLVLATGLGLAITTASTVLSVRSQAVRLSLVAGRLKCDRVALPDTYRPAVRQFIPHIVPYFYSADALEQGKVYTGSLILSRIECIAISETVLSPYKTNDHYAMPLSWPQISPQPMQSVEGLVFFRLPAVQTVADKLAIGEELALNYSRPYNYPPLGNAKELSSGEQLSYSFLLEPGLYMFESHVFGKGSPQLHVSASMQDGDTYQQLGEETYHVSKVYKLPKKLHIDLSSASTSRIAITLRVLQPPKSSANAKVKLFVHKIAMKRVG